MPPSTSVVISQLEPAVFLRGQSASGEDARGRRRPVNMAAQPSQLRALLTLHVSKPIRVREITITLEGTSHTEWPEGIGPNRLELFEDSEIIRQSISLYSAKRDHDLVQARTLSKSVGGTPFSTPPTTPGPAPLMARGRSSSLGSSQPPFQLGPVPRSSSSSSRGGRSSSTGLRVPAGRNGPAPSDRVLVERESKPDLRAAITNVATRAGAALRPPSPSPALSLSSAPGSSDSGCASPLTPRGREGAPAQAAQTPAEGFDPPMSAFALAERERILSPLEKGLKKLNLARTRGRGSSHDSSQPPPAPTPTRPTAVRSSSRGASGGPPPAPSAARSAAPISISRVPESESEEATSHQAQQDYFNHIHHSPTSLPGSTATTPYTEDPPSYTYDPPEDLPDAAMGMSTSDDALPLSSEPTSVGSLPSTFAESGSSSHEATPPEHVGPSPAQPPNLRPPSISPESRAPRGRPVDPARESVWAAGPQGKGILHHTPRERTRDFPLPAAGAVRFDPEATRSGPERDRKLSSNSSTPNSASSSPPIHTNIPADRHRPKLGGMGMLSRALADGQSRDREEDSREYKPGTYTFPICIPLPGNLPPTLHADFGGNKYVLKALVQRPGALTPNLTAEKEVTLVHAPEDEIMESLDPIVVQRIWEDALSYVVIISGKNFPIGSKIPIWLKFVPLTKISVHRLSVSLEEKTDYFAKGRRVARHENPRRWHLVNLSNSDGTPLLPVADDAGIRNLQSTTLAPMVVAGADPGDVTGPDPEDALARMVDPNGPWEMVLDLDIPKKLHKINLSSSHTKSNIAVHHTLRIVIRIERGADGSPSSQSTKGRLFDIVIEAPIALNHSYTNDDWIKLPNYDHVEGTSSLPTDGVGEGLFQTDSASTSSGPSTPASPANLALREEDRGRSRNSSGMIPRLLGSSTTRDRSSPRGPSNDRGLSQPRSSTSSGIPLLPLAHRTPRSSQEGPRPSQTGLESAVPNVHPAESRTLSRRWLALSQASARFGTRLELPGEHREDDDGLPEPSGPPPPPYQTAVFSLPVAPDPEAEALQDSEHWG